MDVKRAKSAGFCFGVSRALRLLDKEIEKSIPDGRLITLGPIIHNPLVMDEYAQKGVICEEDIKGVGSGDRVIIRAHGIPTGQEKELINSGTTIIDATCPKVKKAQLAIAEQTSLGKCLLLFGEKDHPEVQGLISYAGECAYVFSSVEEIPFLSLQKDTSYFLAAQTTQDKRAFIAAAEKLAVVLGYAPLVLNTICDATQRRQEEAITIAKEVEAMIVVGGLNSGNTRRLADVAKGQGVPSIHIESLTSLNVDALKGINTIGLTAGASTPAKYIDAVENFLHSYP